MFSEIQCELCSRLMGVHTRVNASDAILSFYRARHLLDVTSSVKTSKIRISKWSAF